MTSDWKLSEWSTGRTHEEIDEHRDLLERADDLERPPRAVDRDE